MAEALISNISSGDFLVPSLDALGTLLREETVRNSQIITDLIPNLVSQFCRCTEKSTIFSALRVFINLTADSDSNRLALIEYDDFWLSIQRWIDTDRTSIFLAQFVKNSDHITKFAAHFYNMKFDELLFKELVRDFDIYVAEVLAEIWTPEILQPHFKPKAVGYVKQIIEMYKLEHDEEEYELLSRMMYNLTQFDDLEFDTSLLPLVYEIFDIYTESSKVNRQLFSTVGNLSSMKNFGDVRNVKSALNALNSSNLYLKAACYLVVGNYITSVDTRDEVMRLVDNQFIETYFNQPFNDVVQYQSVHTIKHLLVPETSYLVINNPKLLVFSKIICDNKNYYKEVYDNYINFIKKLINLSFPQGDIYQYNELWQTIDNPDIYIQLSKFMNEDENTVNDQIAAKLFLEPFPAEAVRIMERIKYASVVVKSHPNWVKQLQKNPQFLQQMQQLEQMLKNGNDSQEFKVIVNNSKFLSATLLSIADPDLLIVCKNILATT